MDTTRPKEWYLNMASSQASKEDPADLSDDYEGYDIRSDTSAVLSHLYGSGDSEEQEPAHRVPNPEGLPK